MPRLLHSAKALPTQYTPGSETGEVELRETKNIPQTLTANTSEHHAHIHTRRNNGVDRKEVQLANSSAVMQHIHIISSDDGEDLDAEQSLMSGQMRGFAGFSSPRNNIPNALPDTTRRSPHLSKTMERKDSSSGGGVLGGKRSSYDSQLSVGGSDISAEELMTPIKRKKEPHKFQKEDVPLTPPAEPVILPAIPQTPPADQVVFEVNSNSTTHSQRQKRLLRRYTQHPNIQQLNSNTKCSTETSSEFPVSSPSNPHPGGITNKFLQRQPLLKNTLPSDCFERQLAVVTQRNPQMTLADKIRAWKCDPELSDVEDVNEFDAIFQRVEDSKRRSLRSKKSKLEVKENEYDFLHFRNVILKNLKSQKKNAAQLEGTDKPSTSAVAAASQLRRHEKKTRPQKEQQQQKKKTQSSTTPAPATSSSSPSSQASSTDPTQDDFHALHKKKAPQNLLKLHVHEQILCPSSSSEGGPPATTNTNPETIVRGEKEATTTTAASASEKTKLPATKTNLSNVNSAAVGAELSPPKTWKIDWTSVDEDSVFRLNHLKREIDKKTEKSASNNNKPKRLIEMRLDFDSEKKHLNLREKKGEIFKTPIVPVKHVPCSSQNTLRSNNNVTRQESISPNVVLLSESGDDDVVEQEELPAPPLVAPSVQQHVGVHQAPDGLHQQHEFCNYLGLTGMSTATAVATAVEELARSKIARRSLRVRRKQHEQEKSEKERQQLESLKMKQLREIERHEKSLSGFGEFNMKMDNYESASGSLAANEAVSGKNIVLKNIKTLAEAVPKSEIKIICHIAADDKTQKLAEKCIKIITEPIRNTLHQELKKGTPSIVDGRSPLTTIGRSTLSETSDQELKSANADHDLLSEKGKSKEQVIAISPPTTRHDSQTPIKIDHKNSQHQLCFQRSPSTHSDMDVAAGANELGQVTTEQMLHMKFQGYLRASRCTKPRIFIVQSIDSDNKKFKNLAADSVTDAADDTVPVTGKLGETEEPGPTQKHIENFLPPPAGPVTMGAEHNSNLGLRMTAPHRTGGALLKRRNKRRLGDLLTRSVLNTTTQRQLRNRKIVIFKTIKRKALPAQNIDKLKKKSWKTEVKKKISTHILKLRGNKSITPSSCRNKAVFKENKNTLKSSAIESQLESVDKSAAVTPVECASESPIPYLVESLARSHEVYSTAESIAESAGAQVLNALYEEQQPLISSPEKRSSPVSTKAAENELVVVSSTTNCYDEQATKECSNTNILGGVPSKRSFIIDKDPVYTKDMATQSVPEPSNGIHQLTPPSSPLKNPLKSANGKVLYIYYELDVLIVVQEMLVSFWKYSKLLNILNLQATTAMSQQQTKQPQHSQQQREAESSSPALDNLSEWLHLGEFKRLQYDFEVNTPYSNRICVHNSIPIYVEMRCKELQKERRDCNLLSLYINVYYYNDEQVHAKMHSIQLDSVQSFPANVIYTTITDSRYFVMSWPQENILGKMRSGLCKYSLTPHLDTLASIREFKSMRHEICYLECTDDDKLVGFGATQITIWDHRSGDVLMNYDLDFQIGRNLGSIYYPCLEIGQSNMILLFQLTSHANEVVAKHIVHDAKEVVTEFADSDTVVPAAGQAEVQVIACNISHVSPSHRVLFRHSLPSPNFTQLTNAINTGEHILVSASNDEEIWINSSDPRLMTFVPPQNSQRFYVRGRSQIIELTEQSLAVNCFAAHVLKIAATAPASTSTTQTSTTGM